MEYKAKFKGAIKGNNRFWGAWEHTDLLYEYRGHEYIITKDNNGYMGTLLWKQHREEQRRIDEEIAHENDLISKQSGKDVEEVFRELIDFWE